MKKQHGPKMIWQERIAKAAIIQLDNGTSEEVVFSSILPMLKAMNYNPDLGEIKKCDFRKWIKREREGYYSWLDAQTKHTRSFCRGTLSFKAFEAEKEALREPFIFTGELTQITSGDETQLDRIERMLATVLAGLAPELEVKDA